MIERTFIVISLSCKPLKVSMLFRGAKVFDSIERLPNGEELVRWHLLDENHQLIKPVERFLRSKHRAGATVGTIKTYAGKLKEFLKYLEIKEIDWHDFSLSLMNEFDYWYSSGGKRLEEKVVSRNPEEILATRKERTVSLTITVIIQFYDFHTSIGTVEDKELRKYRTVRKTQQKEATGHTKGSKEFTSCLSSEQVERLIDACGTARDKLMLWLLANMGMRRGELLGIHKSDLDWTTETIKIVRRNNPNHAYARGKERELSMASLLRNQEFCKILREYLDEEYPHKVIEQLKHDMLFVVLHNGSASHGKPLEPQNLNKLLKRLQEKTNIELQRVYPHLLRHIQRTPPR
jgi:site-specific recombinase XerD